MAVTLPAPLDDLPAVIRRLEAEGKRFVRLVPEPDGAGLVLVYEKIAEDERHPPLRP